MSDAGRGGVLPEDQLVGEYQAPQIPETPAGTYDPGDVAAIDQAYERGDS